MNDRRRESRDTLKSYFRDGCLPRQEHFWRLIESTVNIADEGFNRSDDDGLQILNPSDSNALLSFFKGEVHEGRPPWQIAFAPETEALQFRTPTLDEAGDRPSPLVLNPQGRVGIKVDDPVTELDVAGTVRMEGRVGTCETGSAAGVDPSEVVADGSWHAITNALSGCQALEIVAGVRGTRRSGKCALIHAVALNLFNPGGWLFNWLGHKNRIRAQHAYYRTRWDRLHLRWKEEPSGPKTSPEARRYRLEIKTRSDYGKSLDGGSIRIVYHVTSLWNDPQMEGSMPAAPEGKPASSTGGEGASDDAGGGPEPSAPSAG